MTIRIQTLDGKMCVTPADTPAQNGQQSRSDSLKKQQDMRGNNDVFSAKFHIDRSCFSGKGLVDLVPS